MATTFTDVETMPIYPLILPVDINTGTVPAGNFISMKEYNHARIVIFAGAVAGSSAMTIQRAKSIAAGSAETWTGWDYMHLNANPSAYYGEDASPTKKTTLTAVTSYTYAIAAANKQIEVEFDAIDLGGGDWDCFNVVLADPGAADIICAFVILSGARHTGASENPPDALTD
jgi:hypothetical protein